MTDDDNSRTAEEKGESQRDFEQEVDEAKEEVKKLEENPPEKLEDWPSGKAKYETFGGPEHETSYEEAATSKLGPADVRHHEGGKVTVAGEEVDPDEYKGDPIPGGPTDPNAPKVAGEKDFTKDEEGEEQEGEEQEGEEQEGERQEGEGEES
jgi:hypothetical protein